MTLIIEPNELCFPPPYNKVVSNVVTLTNPSSEKTIAFKVKTTAPKRYCVRPNTGIIKPEQIVTVEDTPTNLNSKDKFLFQSVEIDPTVTDAKKEVWSSDSKGAIGPLIKVKIKANFSPTENNEDSQTNTDKTESPSPKVGVSSSSSSKAPTSSSSSSKAPTSSSSSSSSSSVYHSTLPPENMIDDIDNSNSNSNNNDDDDDVGEIQKQIDRIQSHNTNLKQEKQEKKQSEMKEDRNKISNSKLSENKTKIDMTSTTTQNKNYLYKINIILLLIVAVISFVLGRYSS